MTQAAQQISSRESQPVQKHIKSTLSYILMTLLAVVFLFPTIFMFVSSLKGNDSQLLADMSTIYAFVPYGDISLKNYSDVFQQVPFFLYLFNSILIVSCITFLGLFVNSLIAYALARMRFPARTLLLSSIVALIIVPFEAFAIPLLLMVNQLPWIDGSTTWLDSYHVQIIPFIADAFSIYLFYQFFIGIPKDFEEAALIDGAGRLRMYWQLIVPLSRPVFASVAILQFTVHIGDFLWPVLVTRGDTYRPLMVGLQVFFGLQPVRWGPIMAFACMVTIPILVVFFLFQKWFFNSVTSLSIK